MRKILLIDDDPALRDALHAALAAHGHVVFCAEDGIAALPAAVETRPNFIISDVNMPLLEGPDAVRILKALPMFRRVPVVLMSGAELSATRVADAAVRKPVTTERLLELIQDVTCSTASPGAPSRDMPMRTAARDERWDPTQAVASLGHPSNTQCVVRICRGIELMHAQAFRTGRLRRLGLNTAESERLYDRLVESVATLVQLLPFR
ncbi:CheY-like chemotaxis protein [Paraburkholderia youngii]|uniref:response regulator n=1 Tax=Paraburkholderia youngii TaxID=2782701 RepID=UPI003D2309DB